MSEQDKKFRQWFRNFLTSEGMPLLCRESAKRGWNAAKTHYEETWLIENEKKILALEASNQDLSEALEFVSGTSYIDDAHDVANEALKQFDNNKKT